MAVYKVNDGFVISSGGTWLPGAFETRGAAHLAFRLSDDDLAELNRRVNIEGSRTITLKDVQEML